MTADRLWVYLALAGVAGLLLGYGAARVAHTPCPCEEPRG